MRDDDEVDAIELPAQRAFRHDEYQGFSTAWVEGFEWADDDELVQLVKDQLRLRLKILGDMRNCAWWIRNHRVCSAPGVLERVREYSAGHHLLLNAGAHPLVMDAFLSFYMAECGCKGDCVALEFDPLNVPTEARLCDKLFRAVHEAHQARQRS